MQRTSVILTGPLAFGLLFFGALTASAADQADQLDWPDRQPVAETERASDVVGAKAKDSEPQNSATVGLAAPKAEVVNSSAAAVAADPARTGSTNAADVTRLMARASGLLAQGNIIAARAVLERAAEVGSAQASFTLAETYDPLFLPKLKVYGTRGDVTKAKEFYARAAASGIKEAGARLEALAPVHNQ
jgi:hypothetical protein